MMMASLRGHKKHVYSLFPFEASKTHHHAELF